MTEKVLEVRIESLEREIKRQRHIIDGNGRMGLRTKLTLLFWGHWPFSMALGALIKNLLEGLLK